MKKFEDSPELRNVARELVSTLKEMSDETGEAMILQLMSGCVEAGIKYGKKAAFDTNIEKILDVLLRDR